MYCGLLCPLCHFFPGLTRIHVWVVLTKLFHPWFNCSGILACTVPSTAPCSGPNLSCIAVCTVPITLFFSQDSQKLLPGLRLAGFSVPGFPPRHLGHAAHSVPRPWACLFMYFGLHCASHDFLSWYSRELPTGLCSVGLSVPGCSPRCLECAVPPARYPPPPVYVLGAVSCLT